MPRKLKKPWLEAYVDYISPYSQSPPEFHFWSGATVLAAALKRHVWTVPRKRELYPNLYTVFVGRPAVGKGEAMNPAIEILRESGCANIMSDRLTIEYVLKKLSEGYPITGIRNGQITFGNEASAIILAPELSVFLRHGTDALGDLTQLWDNMSFDYGTRHGGFWPIKDPCLCLLAASPPRWLAKSIPNDAIGGGFTRRVNFVYTKNDPIMPEWLEIVKSGNGTGSVFKDLIEDLKHISSNLYGKINVTPDFIQCFNDYTKGIKIEDFDDEATTGYKSSKWLNAVKLAMVLCVSESDDMLLKEKHFQAVIPRVEQIEKDIQIVFGSVGESEDTEAAALILEFVEKRGACTFLDIRRALWRHVSRDDTLRIISGFVEVGFLLEKSIGHQMLYQFNMRQPKPGKTP